MRAELERLVATWRERRRKAKKYAEDASAEEAYTKANMYGHQADAINGCIADLARILTRSDWIPASERLPPEGKLRLVQVLNLSDPDDMCCAYLWRGDWLMQTPDDMPDAIVHGVIAWQELPAPYREET